MEKKRRFILLFFLAAVCVMTAVVVYTAAVFKTEDIRIHRDEIQILDDWQVSQDGNTVILQGKLPEEIQGDTILWTETNMQQLRIWVDGRLVYEFGVQRQVPFGSHFGSCYNYVKIPPHYSQAPVTLEYTQKVNHIVSSAAPVYLSNKSSAVIYILRENLGIIVLTGLMMFSGVLFICFAVWGAVKKVRYGIQSILYVGLFLALCGVWLLTDSKVLQLVDGNRAWTYLLSFFSFMLMPVPFLLYAVELCSHGKKFFQAAGVLHIVLFLGNLFLYISGISELHRSILSVHALMFMDIVVFLAISFQEQFRYGNREVRGMILGMNVLCFFTACSVLLFYTNHLNWYANVSMIGLVVFAVCLGVSGLKKCISLMRAHSETLAYKRLAYMDFLTKLYNRAAYEREAERLEALTDRRKITLLILDLNSLKYYNDTYGHQVGDEIICAAADCIRDAFGDLGKCYRIGGDEFAVLLEECTEKALDEGKEKLHELIRKYNETHPYHLSMACGEGSGDKEIKMAEIFQAADSQMYRNKKLAGVRRGEQDGEEPKKC